MIAKGLSIVALAAGLVVSGCATGPSDQCCAPCAPKCAPCPSCKGMSHCKSCDPCNTCNPCNGGNY